MRSREQMQEQGEFDELSSPWAFLFKRSAYMESFFFSVAKRRIKKSC